MESEEAEEENLPLVGMVIACIALVVFILVATLFCKSAKDSKVSKLNLSFGKKTNSEV